MRPGLSLRPERAFTGTGPGRLGTTTTIQVDESRTATVGFNVLPQGQVDPNTGENWSRDPNAATMITGDLSLLEIQLVVQYYISNLNDYLFAADDPSGRPDGQSIKDAAEIALRRSMGHRTLDRALLTDREAIELETMEYAQSILNTYETGLTITAIQLQEIKPPDAVQEAFDDVLKAREEKDKRINEALAFESRTLPEARGQAERIRQEAQAYKQEKINQAQGEALRFEAVAQRISSVPEHYRHPHVP